MKRLFVLIILSCLITTPLTGAVGTAQYSVDQRVTVEINPNAELLGVVYYLAFGRNDTFVIDRGGYLNDVDSYFGPYRNQPVVKILRKYLENYTSIPKRDYQLMLIEYYLLLCSDPPEIKPRVPSGFPWFDDDFLPALRDFARETNFMGFYSSHVDYYREDLNIYTAALRLLPPDGFMANYSGFSNVEYRFEHPFLLAVHGHSFDPVIDGVQVWGAGGMLPLVRRTPQRTVWSFKTARDTMFGLPLNRDIMNSTRLDELLYLGFIYHELGHDVTLQKLYEEHDTLENLDYLQKTIENDMPYLAKYDIHFWNPNGMLYESFADSWEDFALLHVNENYSLLAMDMQEAWGEFWIWTLFSETRECALKVRAGEVGNFTSCVPQILNYLRKTVPPEKAAELYQKVVPVTPLRAFDRGAQAGRVVIVYGTQNPDPTGTLRDRKTARAIAENLRKFYSLWPEGVEVDVKSDAEVTPDDLRANLVIVGGPVSNALAKEMQGAFPIRFRKINGEWVLWRNVSWESRWMPDSFLLLPKNSPKRASFGNVTISHGYFSPVDKAGILIAIRNPKDPRNYVVWIAGANRDLTALFQNPTYYLSSYEIWSKKGIEIGFYAQPLAPS